MSHLKQLGTGYHRAHAYSPHQYRMDPLDIATGVVQGRVASNANGPLHAVALAGHWKFEEFLAPVVADINAAIGSNRRTVGPGAKFSLGSRRSIGGSAL